MRIDALVHPPANAAALTRRSALLFPWARGCAPARKKRGTNKKEYLFSSYYAPTALRSTRYRVLRIAFAGQLCMNFNQSEAMIEIIMLIGLLLGVTLPLAGLAKHRRRRRNPNFVALPFRTSMTLSTLAATTAFATGTLSGNFTEDFRCISVDSKWSITGLTDGEGPIAVGFAHNDYSVGEIKEALEVNLLGPGNKTEQEQAGRLVRDVGTFEQLTNTNLNDGNLFRTRLNWQIQDGKELDVYAFNEGSQLTTGTIVFVSGKLYGYWQV